MSRVRCPLGNFPFRVGQVELAADVGPGTLWPFGMTLAAAMHFYWVSRLYTATAHCTVTTNYGAPADFTDAVDVAATAGVNLYSSTDPICPANDETDLIDLTPYDVSGQANSDATPHGGGLGVGLGVWRFPVGALSPLPSRIVFCTATGLYYPLMGVAATYSGHFGESSFEIAFNSFNGYTSDEGPFDSPTSSLQFMGQSVPLFAYRGTAPVTGSCILGLAPTQFWPYADILGENPLYDDVGNPSINPATGVAYTPSELAAKPWP